MAALTQLLFWTWSIVVAPALGWWAAFAIDRTDAVLWLLVLVLPAVLALSAAAAVKQPRWMYFAAPLCAMGASSVIFSALSGIR